MSTLICQPSLKKTFILLLMIVSISYSSFAQQIGYLKIKVNETATIYLNNRNLGDYGPNDQILKEVPLGTSQIKVMKDGYETQTKNITISVANEIKEISFILQRPQSFQVDKDVSGSSVSVEYGELTVITKLSGSLVPAKVYVDGKFADNAPVKLSKLFVGIHTIEVDYNSIKKSKTISIEKNKKDVLEIELLTTSKITFSTNLNGVEGWIDNNVRFTIPTVKLVSTGEKTFSFSSEGYYPASKTIFINGESEYSFAVNLKRELPNISLEEIGRTYKKPYEASTFLKPESKTVKDNRNKPLWMLFGGLVGFMGGALAVQEISEDPLGGALIGAGVGLLIPAFIIKPKYNKVSIDENIRYNRNEVPRILREKNAEIEKYNQETQNIVKQKQLDKYSESAIVVQNR